MKTFDEEYEELLEWFIKEHEKIDAMNIPMGLMLDGEDAELRDKAGDEYRKRLKALKEKYNRE